VATDAVTIRILADASQATAALKRTGDQAEASLGADGQLGTASKEGEEGLGKVESASGGLMSGLISNLGPMAAMVGGMALVTEVGHAIFDTFNADQSATAALNVAMKDAGEKVTPAFSKSLADLQGHGESLGYASADTTNAFAALTVAGLNTTQATKAMPAIYDLAAAKHIGLADAASDVVKAMQGQSKALKDLNVTMPASLPTTAQLTAAQTAYTAAVDKYGPTSDQAVAAHQKLKVIQDALADRTKNVTTITGLLEAKLGGSAAAAADTFGGKLNVLKVTALDVAAKGVGDLAGGLNILADGISHIIDWVSKWVGSLHGLWTVVGQVFGDIKGAVSDVVGWISANWTTISDVFKVVWQIIVDIFHVYWDIISTYLQVEFAIISTAIKVAWDVISTIIGTAITVIIGIVKGVAAVVGILTGIWQTVTTDVGNVISGIVNFFTGLPGKIGTAITGVAGMITGPFKAAFNAVAGLWNNTLGAVSFQVPGWIPGIGGDKFGFPKIPTFHDGGVVPGAPGSEVFARLLAGEAVLSPSATRSLMSGGGAAAGAGGATVYLTAITTSDPNAISRSVVSGLRTGTR
jgi:hypothetical protein